MWYQQKIKNSQLYGVFLDELVSIQPLTSLAIQGDISILCFDTSTNGSRVSWTGAFSFFFFFFFVVVVVVVVVVDIFHFVFKETCKKQL